MPFKKGHKPPPGAGRPKGSKTKTPQWMREAIISKTNGFKLAIDIACGKRCVIGTGENKRTLTPEITDIIAANRILITRVLPSLHAQEIDLTATIENAAADGAKDWLQNKFGVVTNEEKASGTG